MYLDHIRLIKVWVRYLAHTTSRASSQGAMGISLYRRKKHDYWQVDPNWQWTTVSRRPLGLQNDTEFLIEKLRDKVSTISTDCADIDEYYRLLSDLRLCYVQEKMS